VIHDGMPYDPIQGQGQGHGGPKAAKMADFEVYLFHNVRIVEKANGEL